MSRESAFEAGDLYAAAELAAQRDLLAQAEHQLGGGEAGQIAASAELLDLEAEFGVRVEARLEGPGLGGADFEGDARETGVAEEGRGPRVGQRQDALREGRRGRGGDLARCPLGSGGGAGLDDARRTGRAGGEQNRDEDQEAKRRSGHVGPRERPGKSRELATQMHSGRPDPV